MVKTEKSREKKLVIQGIVVDTPFTFGYGVSDWLTPDYDAKFLLELKANVSVTFKKSESVTLGVGETILVKHTGEFYVRKGESVELAGARVFRLKHDANVPDSIFVNSRNLYNETMQFSFKY